MDVIIRTAMYSIGVLFVQLLEKAFESRHEDGGFGNAMVKVFQHRDIYKVWAGTLIISISLFFYNVYSVLKHYFAGNKFARILFTTPLEDLPSNPV